MIAAEPTLQAVMPDGTVLPWWSDRERMRGELMRFAPADCERFLSLELRLSALARHLEPLFMQAPPDLQRNGLAGLAELLRFAFRFRGLRGREIADLIAFATGSLGEFLDRSLDIAASQVAGPGQQPLRQAWRTVRSGNALRPGVPSARRRAGVEAGIRRPRHGRHGRHHRGDVRGLSRAGSRAQDREPGLPGARARRVAPMASCSPTAPRSRHASSFRTRIPGGRSWGSCRRATSTRSSLTRCARSRWTGPVQS